MERSAGSKPSDERIAAAVRQYEIERFYFEEAALLDAHRYQEWLSLFSDDAHYFMPIRRTRMQRELDKEFTQPGEMAFFDDDKMRLAARIAKLETGRSWAEDPPSRTRHLITNVRVVNDDGRELQVESNFHVYRTRLRSEEDSWIGSRRDVLRKGRWIVPNCGPEDLPRADRSLVAQPEQLLLRSDGARGETRHQRSRFVLIS